MLKKIILSTLITCSISFAYANKPSLPPNLNDINSELIQSYRMEGNHLITNTFDKSKVPDSVAAWIPWVKKEKALQECPINPDNTTHCVFIVWGKLFSQSTNTVLDIKGSSYVKESWIQLPGDVWPNKVLVNGHETVFVEKDGKPYVKVGLGEFNISMVFDTLKFKQLKSLSLGLDLVSFINNTDMLLNYDSGTIIFNNKKEEIVKEKKEQELTDIKIYRQLTDGIPEILETQIKILYSGSEKEVELGAVIPKDFTLLNATSDLKVSYKNNSYYVVMQAGEHSINLISVTKNNIDKIVTQGLIKGIDKEFWSIVVNNNIRQINIGNANQVDARQVLVPDSWASYPTYIVKDSISFKTERQGMNIDNHTNIVENRTSWYGYNNEKMVNNSNITVENRGKQFFSVNKNLHLESFKVSEQPQMLVKKDNEQGIIANIGQFNAQVQTELNDIHNIPAKFFDGDVNNNGWDLNLAPRYRLLGASGVERIAGSWVDSWNLYSVFTLCILTFAFYRLFGRSMAVLAFIGIVSFQENSFLSWQLWIGLLIVTALIKVLPESKNQTLSDVIKKVGLLLFAILICIAIPYINKEIRYIINPSLELVYSGSHISAIEIISLCFYIAIGYMGYKAIKSFKHKKGSAIPWIIGMIICWSIPSFMSVSTDSMFGTRATQGNIGAIRNINGPVAAPAPSVIQESDSMKSMGSIVPGRAMVDLAEDKSKENELIMLKKSGEEEKIQVGHGLPTWSGHGYHILANGKKEKNIDLWIMSPLLVNIMAITQIGILLLTILVFGIYLGYAYNKDQWVEKIPEKIRNNKLIKLLINDLQGEKA
jgi:hypothetical protein